MRCTVMESWTGPCPAAALAAAAQLRAQGAVPLPTSSTCSKAGRNHLNEEIILLFPTGIGERRRQTILNLGHAPFLRRCELSI
jgi:hypothetical protein